MTSKSTTDWTTARFVVVDVEGNGRQPPDIVEFGAVAIENGAIVGTPCEWLVRPTESISHIVSRLHGITNEMVAGSPSFKDIAGLVREVLRNDYLVAHNAKVELGVLRPKLEGWSPRGVVDTLRLARDLLPGRKSYALTALTKDLDLVPSENEVGRGPHRAGYDALATARLFLHLARTEYGTPRALSTLLGVEDTPVSSSSRQGDLF